MECSTSPRGHQRCLSCSWAGRLLIHRGSDETSIGGTVGISLDVHPGSGVSFRVGIEDYVYSTTQTHHDFVLSFSIGADAGL